MNLFQSIVCISLVLLAASVCRTEEDIDPLEELDPENAAEENQESTITNEQLEYTKGSFCGYCDYCKFCKLCDQDCPCETSPSKPNCKMCKYCKYCNLCSAFCDTVCRPGGILDRVSGAIINSLPTFNQDEVDGDIESVQTWIDKKRDEL